jgi:PAS domain S-box-containing protein
MNQRSAQIKSSFRLTGVSLDGRSEPFFVGACFLISLAVSNQFLLSQRTALFAFGCYLGHCISWLIRQSQSVKAKAIPPLSLVFSSSFAYFMKIQIPVIHVFLITLFFASMCLVFGCALWDMTGAAFKRWEVSVKFSSQMFVVAALSPGLSTLILVSIFEAFAPYLTQVSSPSEHTLWFDLFVLSFHGFLTIIPLYLSWNPIKDMGLPLATKGRGEEGVLAFILLTSLVALGFWLDNPGYQIILLFICLPVLLFLSFRFGLRGLTAAIIPVSFFSATHSLTFLELKIFESIPKGQALLLFEMFFGVIHFSAFFSAILASEREEAFERLTQLVNLSPVGVYFKDHEGHVTFQNQKLREMFQFSMPSEFSESPHKFQHETRTEIERLLLEFDNCEFGSETFSRNQVCFSAIEQKNHEIWLERFSAPIITRSGQLLGHVGSIVDISLEKRVRQELERAHALERDHRVKMEKVFQMREEFISVVSHELSTPLSSLMGWIQVLGNPGIPETVKKKALTGALRSADQQNKLIKDLIGFSSLKSAFETTRHRLELRVLLNDIIDSFSKDLRAKNIALRFQHPKHVIFIEGDRERLFDAFRHVVGNAVKFSARETPLRIEVEHQLKVVSIRVTDKGKGIAPQFLPYVFDSFSQEDGSLTRKEGGLGLGLAIAQKVAELHGGKLHAQSEGLGKGAIFTVILPTLDTAPFEDLDDLLDSALTPSQKLKDLRIMVVDDDPDCLEILSTWVESQGAEVQTFSDAMEAYIQVVGLQPHIVLSDLSMPHVDGITFIEKLCSTQHYGDQKILIAAVTAFGDESIKREALSKGFNGYFVKPYRFSELLDWLLLMRQKIEKDGRLAIPVREGASAKDSGPNFDADLDANH